MDANTDIELADLHATIAAAIRAQFPDLQTVEFYLEDREDLQTPACLLDLMEFEDALEEDAGTGQLAVMAHFEAEFVMGFRTPGAKLAMRVLAAAFAAFLNKARWPGGKTGPAEQIHAYKSDFKPELDKYEVWCVEWKQLIHLGQSVWNNAGTVPHTVLVGFTPDIGLGHEDDYTVLEPAP